MFAPVSMLAELATHFLSILASPAPAQQPLAAPILQGHRRFYDVQVCDSHRDHSIFYVLNTSTCRRIAVVEATRSRTAFRASLGMPRSQSVSGTTSLTICMHRGLIDGAATLELDNGITKVTKIGLGL